MKDLKKWNSLSIQNLAKIQLKLKWIHISNSILKLHSSMKGKIGKYI